MTNRWWSDDEQFLAAVDEALWEAREIPRHFLETWKATFSWQNLDAELAALTYDSATDNTLMTATRAERATLRELTFATAHLKIHIQVTAKALQGQIVPPQQTRLELRTADNPTTVVTTDDDGWFTLEPIPIGSFRLHCRTESGITALTDWFAL
ncbi:MAG: hypothetical protein V7637_5597 [Mycobacteriales bacterium]